MSNDAWNKITQTHDLFKKIIAPLKQHLGIDFGYMIVFNDGSYYQIIEDLECLKKWVTNVKTSHIFCARNVTTYFDEPYNFTIWPEEPTCPAMEIYKEYGMWNGITVSRQHQDYTELYWFAKENAENDWHKWFIRNKPLFYKYIKYFNENKSTLQIDLYTPKLETFKFFNSSLKSSSYEDNEIKNTSLIMDLNYMLSSQNFSKTVNEALTKRQLEIFSLIEKGFTYKTVSQLLKISERTTRFHVDKIKLKFGAFSKFDLLLKIDHLKKK